MTILKNLSLKHKIIICLIFAITISTGYFLWQIDHHEKALLGTEWLNPVPTDVWNSYLAAKQSYNNKLTDYLKNNKGLTALIKNYHERDPARPRWASMYVEDSRIFMVPRKDILSLQMLNEFKNDHPEEDKTWVNIGLDLIFTNIVAPIPTNPPKPVIQQSINSLYRYMAAIDGILVLSLVLFLVLYKDNPQSRSPRV